MGMMLVECADEEMERFVKNIVKHKVFQAAIEEEIAQFVGVNGIDADNINDLDGKVEEILNDGSFETTFSG